MKWTIKHQSSPDLFIVDCEGEFTAVDCNSMQDELLSQNDWLPGTGILLDYRDANFAGVRLSELERVGLYHSQLSPRWGPSRMALLMKPGRDFGLARQYELLHESAVSTAMMVFLTTEEAIDWLTQKDESVMVGNSQTV